MFVVGHDYNSADPGVLKAFLPQNFLLEILDKMKEDSDNLAQIDLMQKNWLKAFEQKSFESVFVRWNDELRQQSKDRIVQLCKAIRNEPMDKNRLKELKPIEE